MTSGRKRNVDELLNGEDSLQPRATRQRIDKDISQPTYDDSNSGSSANKERAKTLGSTFLAYPDLSNPKSVSVPFQQPSQLISFSYDASHVQEFSDSALRYFVRPRMGADLSYGYQRWIKRPDERGRIDALLRAISKVKKEGESTGAQLPEIGVVSWRGVMTRYLLMSLRCF